MCCIWHLVGRKLHYLIVCFVEKLLIINIYIYTQAVYSQFQLARAHAGLLSREFKTKKLSGDSTQCAALVLAAVTVIGAATRFEFIVRLNVLKIKVSWVSSTFRKLRLRGIRLKWQPLIKDF